jgi:hypothetical protein
MRRIYASNVDDLARPSSDRSKMARMTALIFTSAPALRLIRFRSRSIAPRSSPGIRTAMVSSFFTMPTVRSRYLFDKQYERA